MEADLNSSFCARFEEEIGAWLASQHLHHPAQHRMTRQLSRVRAPAQNLLPCVGTLMMRLSIAQTPGMRAATFSALARRLPLLDVPISVTLPLSADTLTPAGAMELPIWSPSAELIFASKNLFASADWSSHDPGSWN